MLLNSETFSDPGATASDDRYGDLTADIVVGGDVVDNEAPGVYIITYDVMDREGNAAGQVTRTVTVTSTDVSLPVIALNGPEIVYLNVNDPYNELGAAAYDGCDPNLPSVTVDNSAVNTGVYGAYTVTYNVTDSSSNAAVEVTRTVRVWPALTMAVSGYGTTEPQEGLTHYFAPDTVVDLVAERTPFTHFTGWTGDAVADSTSPETTITMNGAKSVTATFGEGYVVTLAVEGDGTLHYELDSTPYTVTESGGPVNIILSLDESPLPLFAEPDENVSEFWQWLSDDANIDGTYVGDCSVRIWRHTEITAVFAPEGAVDYIDVELEVNGGGTTVPAPGVHRMPRYAGTDLDCLEACQDGDDPLPEGCPPCAFAALRVEAVPDADWVFNRWNGGQLDGPLYTAYADIPVGESTNVVARFLERPGLYELDLLGDLKDFLVEAGIYAPEDDLYDLDLDYGGVTYGYSGGVYFVGNGVPDAAEFALLLSALKNHRLNMTDRGGIAHTHVWDAFHHNQQQAAADLDGASAAAINALAAYITLGSNGHVGRAKAWALELYDVDLDAGDYKRLSGNRLLPEEDADNDGVSNGAEWEQTPDGDFSGWDPNMLRT